MNSDIDGSAIIFYTALINTIQVNHSIASFVKYQLDKRDELILKHPLCDKGIALMLFWRLKTFRNIWFETSSLATEIVTKIRNNEYPEILAYNPKLDKEIKMSEPKPKWKIPEIIKLPI